ncbi:MAG: hypothetical protein ACREMB_24835 [Candidatus Rokuibacteriota bacterium]
MMRDRLGLPVTTESVGALEAYDDAVEGLLGWDGATRERFARAAKADPGLALAHAGAAVALFLDESFAEARAAAERALHAFAGRDHARAIEKVEPLRRRIVELGGSRAQRDVFHDTLLEARFRAGDLARAERLLAERVARRPDAFWLARAAS